MCRVVCLCPRLVDQAGSRIEVRVRSENAIGSSDGESELGDMILYSE